MCGIVAANFIFRRWSASTERINSAMKPWSPGATVIFDLLCYQIFHCLQKSLINNVVQTLSRYNSVQVEECKEAFTKTCYIEFVPTSKQEAIKVKNETIMK